MIVFLVSIFFITQICIYRFLHCVFGYFNYSFGNNAILLNINQKTRTKKSYKYYYNIHFLLYDLSMAKQLFKALKNCLFLYSILLGLNQKYLKLTRKYL